MNENKISVRYAKALFALVNEKNMIEPITQEITAIYDACKNSTELMHVIDSPIIKTSKKKLFFNELLKNSSELVQQFINLLLSNKRETFLPHITRNYLDIYRQHKGIKKVILTSATKLNEATKTRISTLVEEVMKCKIELSEKHEPNIIGGVILRIEDKQMDVSVSTKLKKIRRELLTGETINI